LALERHQEHVPISLHSRRIKRECGQSFQEYVPKLFVAKQSFRFLERRNGKLKPHDSSPYSVVKLLNSTQTNTQTTPLELGERDLNKVKMPTTAQFDVFEMVVHRPGPPSTPERSSASSMESGQAQKKTQEKSMAAKTVGENGGGGVREPTRKLTPAQMVYIFGLHGMVSMVISGGVNFGIAYGKFSPPSVPIYFLYG
jgi:hypothetical protein